MSRDLNFEELEYLDEEEPEGDIKFELEKEEFPKEIQELQSALNKNRLLQLQQKVSQVEHKQFNIYVGEISLSHEKDTLYNKICFVFTKGLTCDWEFPLFTFYIMQQYSDNDEHLKLYKLLSLTLKLLHAIKLQPFACIMDYRPSHQKLIQYLGITAYNPYIEIDRKRTMFCLDFFSSLKEMYCDSSIPSDIIDFMKYFDQECDNLDEWQTQFKNFKNLLENVYSIGVQISILYYTVASRIAALELAKLLGTWPHIKMVCFRKTKLDLFLHRIKLEHLNNYEDLLRVLPDIYNEYY